MSMTSGSLRRKRPQSAAPEPHLPPSQEKKCQASKASHLLECHVCEHALAPRAGLPRDAPGNLVGQYVTLPTRHGLKIMIDTCRRQVAPTSQSSLNRPCSIPYEALSWDFMVW